MHLRFDFRHCDSPGNLVECIRFLAWRLVSPGPLATLCIHGVLIPVRKQPLRAQPTPRACARLTASCADAAASAMWRRDQAVAGPGLPPPHKNLRPNLTTDAAIANHDSHRAITDRPLRHAILGFRGSR
jgi:hypothetical protein